MHSLAGVEYGPNWQSQLGRNGAGDVGDIVQWSGTKFFSDLVHDGLQYINEQDHNETVIMVFEGPTSSAKGTSFYNVEQYRLHDYPPTPLLYMTTLRPLRYASMNGGRHPAYLMGEAPKNLVNHWIQAIPNFVVPTFVDTIPPEAKVNAYLPMESVINEHINDPDVHYLIAGKDAIGLMTNKTTQILPNTKDVRPCVAKVTHAMGSLGIFVIYNDDDEEKFFQFVRKTGNPTYVVTDFVDIRRNLACHFFMHPSGDIIWFGSSENLILPDGKWSSDSTIVVDEQKELQELMAPFVIDVAKFCYSKGFWGFAGIDVLFDEDNGYLVDLNPRVTGTMPALMVSKHMKETYGFTIGKFRKSSKYHFPGPSEELFQKVDRFNKENFGQSRIVVFSMYEETEKTTMVNMAVYSNSHQLSESILDTFSTKGIQAASR